MSLPRCFSLALVASLTFGASRTADAQFARLTDKIKEKVDQAGGKTVDGTSDGRKAKPAAPATEKSAAKRSSAAPTTEKSAAKPPSAATTAPTSRKEWANYDFVPGVRAIFFTDFTEDPVGNFPKRLEFVTGQMEIVELDGSGRALKASSSSELIIPLPEVLPPKFTVELDVINRNSTGVAAATFEMAGGRNLADNEFTQVGWGQNGLRIDGGGVPTMSTIAKDADRKRYVGNAGSFRLLGDGSAIRLYVDEKRLANIPNAKFQRDRALVLRLEGRDDESNAVYVTRIRVAEIQKDIYDELTATGRWTTQGIQFETGKSDVKPESTPTLESIAATLKAHPELTVEIQGHTDNVGSADANMTLSQARADAVKNSLVSDYGASADRLTAKGYGDRNAVAKNATPEGRANNRRVEVVKL